MDTKHFDDEHMEVYKYLLDICIPEKKSFEVVNNYEFEIFDSFEDCVTSYIENCGCKLPDFVRLDLVQMWRESMSITTSWMRARTSRTDQKRGILPTPYIFSGSTNFTKL